MTGTNCDLFTHKSSRSYLDHLVSYTFHVQVNCKIFVVELNNVYPALVLRPSCVLEKVGVNKKDVNRK
jgi:hypothetical protein